MRLLYCQNVHPRQQELDMLISGVCFAEVRSKE